MANEENLKPFPPGVSGNPNGRPVGSKNFTTLVREALDAALQYKDENGEIKSEVAKKLLIKRILNKAIDKGDTRMIELIWNYLDGKPMQKFEHGFDRESVEELTQFFREMGKPPQT